MPLPSPSTTSACGSSRTAKAWRSSIPATPLDATRDAWEPSSRVGKPVTRIIVTTATRITWAPPAGSSDKTGAGVVMSQGGRIPGAGLYAPWHRFTGYDVTSMVAHFRHHGLDDDRAAALSGQGNAYARGVPPLPATYQRLIDGDTLLIGGRQWQVIVGYGHAPGARPLYREAIGVLDFGRHAATPDLHQRQRFAATPHDDPARPLPRFDQRFQAVARHVAQLPSHGRPFRGIALRVDQLVQHHDDRCAELLAACTDPAVRKRFL